jgi:hypothetical protein
MRRTCVLLAALAVLTGCSAGQSRSASDGPPREEAAAAADCYTPLQALEARYWGSYTSLNLDLTDQLALGTVPGCSEGPGPKGPSREYEIWQIDGVDPAVAVGSRGANGGRDLVWIACPGDTCPDVVPGSVQYLLTGD